MRTDSSIASVVLPAQLPGRAVLWRVDLDRYAAEHLPGRLSPAEEARADAMSHANALRYRAAHKALRRLLGSSLAQEGAELAFEIGPFGRPAVAGESGLHFSLSRSDGVALIGICDMPIGVDVEVIRLVPERNALAEAHLTAEEFAAWRRVDPDDRDRALLYCWTLKEAIAKALGVGLSLPPCWIDTLGDETRAPRARLGGTWQSVAASALVLGSSTIGAVAIADLESVDEAHRVFAAGAITG